MRVDKPIFIIGCGRSGSSIFHRMFSTHPGVAWLSGYHARHLNNIEIIRYLNYLGDIPVFGPYLRNIVEPGECYELWDQVCTGFSTPERDLLASDLTNKKKKKIDEVLSKALTRKRNRLLIKLTGWPRIGFLNEIYPNAKYIHVIRDGRAVTNSILHVDFWWGWRGSQNWRWGMLSQQDMDEWDSHNRSFVALAGIQWRILMDSMEEAKIHVSDNNYMDIKYEDLCKNTIDIFRKTVEFCELDWTMKFEKYLSEFKLNSQDFKWKEDLTKNQISVLESVLGPHLARYGYMN